MKKLTKKIISIMLLFAMMVCTNMPHTLTYAATSGIGGATGTYADWKNNSIIYPQPGQLVAAGTIYIQWNKLDGATKYDVYIDDQLQGVANATNDNVIEYKAYSTSVASHKVKIVAELSNSTKVTANVRTFYISKKGMGSGMINKVQESGLSWYYHWATDPVAGANSKMQFVPMIWGNSGHNWLTNPDNKKYKTVLGFNEPDFTDQSNVPVDAAITAWPDFVNSGLRVGSPATAVAAPWSSWFSSFMDKINANSNLNVDFIAVHCYLDNTDADTFLKMVDDCYAKYHKPIWITEFGIAEWSQGKWNGNDPNAVSQVSGFMQKVLPELDKRSYVERYAWFPFDPTDKYGGASGLYNVNTGQLNSLGLAYRGLGNPTGYVLPNLDGSIVSGSVPQDVVVNDGLNSGGTAPTTDPAAGVNLALNKKAYASTTLGTNSASNATDGNLNSRWESQFSDGQWMYVDLGDVYSIQKVKIGWETAAGKDYTIQISNDAVNWTTVYTKTNGTGGTEELTLSNPTNGRYVRMNGSTRTTGYGFSIWELEVYGGSANSSGTTPTADPEAGVNLALKKNVTVSSVEGGSYAGTNAVDGNTNSRWSSSFADNQWVSVDLGATKTISKVTLNWEGAYAKGYRVEVSTDGSNWTSAYQTTNGDGGSDEDKFNSVNARYVRVYCTQRASTYGVSLWEIGIYK